METCLASRPKPGNGLGPSIQKAGTVAIQLPGISGGRTVTKPASEVRVRFPTQAGWRR